jgi:hypothetical protein
MVGGRWRAVQHKWSSWRPDAPTALAPLPTGCDQGDRVEMPAGSAHLGHRPGTGVAVRDEDTDTRDDLGAVELDGGHDGVVRLAQHAALEVEAGGAKGGEVGGDLAGDGLGRPNMPGTFRSGLAQKWSLVGAARPGSCRPGRVRPGSAATARRGPARRTAATCPGACTPTGRAGWPTRSSDSRNSCENGLKRAGGPPMMASTSANP